MGLQDTTNITKSRDKERFPAFYTSMAASLNKKVFIGQIFNINPRVQDESSIFLLISFKVQTLKHQYLQNLQMLLHINEVWSKTGKNKDFRFVGAL